MMVGTEEAAKLLRICIQRVRQLIYEGRIKGAKKVGRFWQIPLYGTKPKVSKGSRGPKGNWTSRVRTETIIHVNQNRIRTNRTQGKNQPVIRVQRGSRVRHYHAVEVEGRCQVVYQKKPLNCGACAWLKVEPHVKVTPCSPSKKPSKSEVCSTA